MKEMVESLTQNRLADATSLEALNKQVKEKEKSLEEYQHRLLSFNEISIENEAFKRQLQRLTDENDDLLQQLEAKESSDDFKKQVESLQSELAETTKRYEEKAREMKSLMDNNSAKIKSLIQENSELKASIHSQEDMAATPTDQVKIKYDKCIKKLRLYREKIYDINDKLGCVQADREVLLSTTKEYAESVTKWQSDIACASVKLIERIRAANEQLQSKNEEIESLKAELANQKISTDAIDTKDAAVKILEEEVQKLQETIKSKDQSLNEERDAQRKLKQTVKKTSMLDLEMEAYERTLEELNRKLENKKSEVLELESTAKMQSSTVDSLKIQISTLEENLNAEKTHCADVKKNLESLQSILRKTEHERTEANLQFELLNKNYETLKLENGEIKLEAAKTVGDMQKRNKTLEDDRDELTKRVLLLEGEVDKFKKLSVANENALDDLRAEFASYKIRAQGVLRQSQTKDFSKEQEQQDEIISLRQIAENFKHSSEKISNELETLKKNFSEVVDDKVHLQNRCKDLLENLEKQSNEILEESRSRNQQHEESIKAYQLQIDTLNAFYKKKIQETEENSNIAISSLKEKINNLEKISSTPVSSAYEPTALQLREEHKMNMLLMNREEAEGSEDQSSQSSTFHPQLRRKISSTRGRELMQLDELLNSSFDDNSNEVNEDTISNFSSPSEILENVKAKLAKEVNRVTHLTALLADSEKDLARMQQLNDMLKEEVRRQQRNVDREEHIQNSEYLKNIVIKFVTLNNADEKQRLIPVLNTILRLSSEENNLLHNACKGGWTGLWSK